METNCLFKKHHKNRDTKENIDQYNNLKKEKCGSFPKIYKERTTHQINGETKKRDLCINKLEQEDLKKFCEQLSAFNKRIQTAREVIHLQYDLPFELQEKLEREAEELACLYAELQNAVNNIETIRSQRAVLGKEKLCMEQQLNKLKTDGLSEMEVIVSVYDSSMMEKWGAIKHGSSVPAVENFLHDVKGKLEAMKNLQFLCNQKLQDLRSVGTKEQNVTKEKKKNNREKRRRITSNSNIATLSQTSLPSLLETDSEEAMSEDAVHNMLYSLMCDQVFNLPDWTEALDVD